MVIFIATIILVQYYEYLKEDIKEAIANYGSKVMAESLYNLNILKLHDYKLIQGLKNLPNTQLASVLANIVYRERHNSNFVHRFKKLLSEKSSLQYLFYLIQGAGLLITNVSNCFRNGCCT